MATTDPGTVVTFVTQGDFKTKVTDLPDQPSPAYTASQIKSYIQNPSDELKDTLNKNIVALQDKQGSLNIGAMKLDGTKTTAQDLFNDAQTRLSKNESDITSLQTTVTDNDNRIDNIVASAGTSNTEIVDARYDSVNGTTYALLKDRLDNQSSQLAEIVTYRKGNYTIDKDITFDKLVIIAEGALLTISQGVKVVFNKGIKAGWYKIFETSDDFITNFTSDSSVIINNCEVKADWFCEKVYDKEDILTIPDQTNNLMRAYRAGAGNFIPTGSNFYNENFKGVLRFGFGYYRVDKKFETSRLINGVYYRTNGMKIVGYGSMSSYLVRTDMVNTDYVFFCMYTGQLTNIDNFKIICYNPNGTTQEEIYSSATKSLMFLQGDSLQIGKMWVSGAQVSVNDSNGVARNGVGVQFSSCVDTYFTDLFVEGCNTGVAFGSSVVSGVNLELYDIREQAIGLGVFDANYGDTQNTSSTIHITNIQAPAVKRGIRVLETGSSSHITIDNSEFDGFMSETGIQRGTNFIEMNPNTKIAGNMTSTIARNFINKTIACNSGVYFGRPGSPMNFTNFEMDKQTSDVSSGLFYLQEAAYANLNARGITAKDLFGILLSAPIDGYVSIEGVHLSNYTGKKDTSVNRRLFTSSVGSPQIDIRKVTRDKTDTVMLNEIAYVGSGNVFIDIDNLYNATRVVSGAGTITMPSKVTFA